MMYAKSSSRNDGLGPMPLLTHLLDVAETARQLAEDAPNLHLITEQLGCTTSEAIDIVACIAGLHDIGKASPHYEWMLGTDARGATLPQGAAHDKLGEFWLRGQFAQRQYHHGWPSIVGAHHGWTSDLSMNNNPYDGIEDVLGGRTHEQARVEILTTMLQRYRPRLELVPNGRTLQMIAALVVMADRMGSALPGTTGEHTPERVGQFDFPKWQPKDRTFKEAFGYTPRSFQNDLVSLATSEPSLYLVGAGTGMGKTYGALCLAERTAVLTGATGVFFALPTRVQSNMLYEKQFHPWSRRFGSMEWLAHADARSNQTYMDTNNAHELAHQLRMLTPLCIGVVDHLLRAVLRDKFQMLRHFGLLGKVIVIDEIHSFDPLMSKLLVKFVRMCAAWGMTAIIMSATMPPSLRAELVRSYTRRNEQVPTGITRANASGTVHIPVDAGTGVTYVVQTADNNIEAATTLAGQGANVLVMCNTVKKAQRTYAQLKEMGQPVTLIHSRFTRAHRAALERSILARHGSKVTDRPRGAIVVSTQVLEQSVDVDFDALVTDLATSDMLIQRMGRIMRNRDIERVIDPTIVLVNTHDNWLYSDWALAQTRDVWMHRTSVTLPDEVEDMMVATFEDNRHLDLHPTHNAKLHVGASLAANYAIVRFDKDTLCNMYPYSDDASVRMGDMSVDIAPVLGGRLLDGSDPNDGQAIEANSVSVPASWHMEPGLTTIAPGDYDPEMGLVRKPRTTDTVEV